QRFSHGKGFVIGHQWTNIVLFINGFIIPLPPIPFHTKKYCRENKTEYRTEHELIELLTYITEILRDFLKRKGMRYLADTFMLYRDTRGIRQRVAPDLLVMPFCSPAPSAYDLDTGPPPYAVAEITSPESRSGDTDDKVSLYTGLGIPAYLVIDMFTSRKKFRRQIGLHLWRITEGRVCKIKADADGYLPVPEMRVKTKAQGQNLIFADIVTGEILCDTGQLRQKLEQEAAQAKKEKQRAEKEAELRKQKAAQLEKEKQRTEKEKQRAEKETELRKKETSRAEKERQRAEQLASKLRELGIYPE
ncbi:MAG: hypothetical protein GY749_23270, partial [Desulfobacteraceae bacterium]|nr:hypothetical protein [Desulfobacteraceae bacterium]